MKYHHTLLSLFLLISLNACSVKEFAYFQDIDKTQNKITKKVDEKSYQNDLTFEWKISKGDRIEIQAYNQSSSTTGGQLTHLLSSGGQKYYTTRYGDEGVLINADGIVILPLIGSVKVLGLTEDEASKLLIKKYKQYLKHPYVSVRILNQKLFVLGEVRKPGVVLVTNGTMTLFEALAQTGDLTNYADRTNIKILRGNMRNAKVREVNLSSFESLQYSSLVLRPNDVVYISPRDARASMIGIAEELPFWQLVSNVLAPLTNAAVIYQVIKQ